MTEDTLRDQVAAALCNLGIGHYRGWDHAEAEAVMPSYHEQTADALLAAVPALSVPGGLAEAAGAYLIAIDKWRGRQEAVLAESDAMVWRRAVADAEKALRAALSGDVAKYGWHGNGDLCLGPECGVVDEYGDHPMADVHSNDWYVGYAAGQRDRAALAQRAPERSELRATEKASSDDGLAVPAATPGLAQALDVERLAQAWNNALVVTGFADAIPMSSWRIVAREYTRLTPDAELAAAQFETRPNMVLRRAVQPAPVGLRAALAAADAAEQGEQG